MKRIIISLVLALVAFGSGAEAQPSANPNMFSTMAACEAALESGDLRFYEPRYFGLKTKNPTNGVDRVVVPLESNDCLEMLVVGGRRFVAQLEGTMFRAHKLADGSLSLYARDDCGNPVYGVVYPAPSLRIVLEPVEVVPTSPNIRPTPPRAFVPVPVESRRDGGCGKKCKWAIGIIVGAAAGYAAWYYWPCPPGTVRR